MKVAILTFNTSINYGALLQSYALQKAVDRLGHESFHVRIQMSQKKLTGKALVNKILKAKKNSRYRSFMERNIRYAEGCYTEDTISNTNKEYDAFISGSDQVWNVSKGVSNIFYQAFVEDTKRKVSYAASIGINSLPEQYEETVKTLIDRFDAVSVRENTAQQLLSQLLPAKPIEVVLDPVFLLSASEWDLLCGKPMEKKPYIFVYGTQMTGELIAIAHDLQKKTGLPIKSVFPMQHAQTLDYSMGPVEFVNYVKHAEYVVTTSFHCTAFSMIYNKNIIEVLHSSTGSRAKDLLQSLGMEDCIYNPSEDYSQKKWDFQDANKIMAQRIAQSKCFLEMALCNKEN